jgi:uncharacterized membrane protein YbhN (UPF0104 family)
MDTFRQAVHILIEHKFIRFLIGLSLVFLVLFFVLDAVKFQWSELAQYEFSFGKNYPFWLVISLMFIMSSFIIQAASWNWLLNRLSSRVPYLIGIRVFFLSQLGRYIPGKIWTFLGRYSLNVTHNVPKVRITESIFYELLTLFLSGMVVFSSTFIIFGNSLYKKIDCTAIVILVASVFFLMVPRLSFNIINPILIKYGKNPINIKIRTTYLIFYFILNVFAWILQGFGIFFLSRSFLYLSISKAFLFPGIFCVSWLGGFLSVFTPSGIGVREGILIYFLSQYIEPSSAIIIAAGSRIWLTLCELLCLGLVQVLFSFTKKCFVIQKT